MKSVMKVAIVPELGELVKCQAFEAGTPPLFIEPASDALENRETFLQWMKDRRSILDELICEYGGVVLRGFPISETAHFAALMQLFPNFHGDYKGGVAPRMQIAGQVMEATRLDCAVRLRLHSEMAYLSDYPLRIAFFSKKTADVGGETIIGDVRGLLESLPQQLRNKLEEHGIMTVRNYAPRTEALDAAVPHMDLRGWNLAFETDEPAEVEKICRAKGLDALWNEDDSLTVMNRTKAAVVHPKTGQILYRSNLHSYNTVTVGEGLDAELVKRIRASQKHPTGTFLGNGEALKIEEVQHFERFLNQRTRAWPWLDGDVMILDNLQTWHGRNPYQGSRDVQVAMLD
jgi:alpha-ketoglutarate-dependent taurine dioxygenase